MSSALQWRTIALAESRQLEELAQMLEKEGATAWRCPMVSIIDAPDPAPILAWLQELIADRFALVILMTGEALRRLLGFAGRGGLREDTVAALGRTRTMTRGPKPIRALKEIGLSPWKVAERPTTEGVIASLKDESFQGRTVGLTLYGEPNPTLVRFLEEAGATVRPVLPYIYAPASDTQRVEELIRQMSARKVDGIIFTSSPQVDRLYEVAANQKLEPELQKGLALVKVAAVGPVVAENLRQRGTRVDICPDQGFVMKNLVQLIKRELGQDCGSLGRG